jgi:Ca-activated chloride channel family protein
MDVSGSMRATDVKPSRMVAAQEAARGFIDKQPKTTRIGVVSFAATASVVQSPTHSREDLLAAIDRFQLQAARRSAAAWSSRCRRCCPTPGSTSTRSSSSVVRPPAQRVEGGGETRAGAAGFHQPGRHRAALRWRVELRD